ncbi:MAG: M4 family metallopeptidase [Planctomycetes bacterium]|nr:M4 family metallopeptidase [Planctomycetota bacterium]
MRSHGLIRVRLVALMAGLVALVIVPACQASGGKNQVPPEQQERLKTMRKQGANASLTVFPVIMGDSAALNKDVADVVALLLENRPEFLFHYLALNARGVSIVPVNPDYRHAEMLYQMDHSEADLIYANQSGALDESYADFFGAMVDSDDWLMGEDIGRLSEDGAGPGTCQDGIDNGGGGATDENDTDCFFRDISNPPRKTASFDTDGDTVSDVTCIHPDHMSNFCNMTVDNGGVHENSGIPNKVAFLITDGGLHNGIPVTGIGREKAQRLYYDVLTKRLTELLTAALQTLVVNRVTTIYLLA